MYHKAITDYIAKHNLQTFAPKAVLFDMDGVLFNSMPNHAQSWHKAMLHYGIDMKPADAYQYEGMRGVETIQLLAQKQWGHTVTPEKAQEMYNLKSHLFTLCPKAGVMDGVKPLMHEIKKHGMKIVVVTGSGQHSLLSTLCNEFDGLVTAPLIITAHDVKHGKPNPEPYIKGLAKAGVSATEAVVIENAPLGVRAAVAAGIFTIGVNTGPLPDETLYNEGANIVFSDMDSLRKALF